SGSAESTRQQAAGEIPSMELHPSRPFAHKWPDGSIYNFDECFSGLVQTQSGAYKCQVGFLTPDHASAGRRRLRGVIFMDRRPYVEFIAADHFATTGLMASVVKDLAGRRAKSLANCLPGYSDLPVLPYSTLVTGPNGAKCLAVVCKK